jgi:hypothetical protein
MSKVIGKLKCAVSFRSTRSSSSCASTDIEVGPPSLAVRAPSHSAPMERNVLLQEKQLKLRDDTEKDTYKKLKTQRFVLTLAYDLALLQAIGMNTEFELIFKAIGWEDIWKINEPGSKLLCAEFLCTLKPTNLEVSFRLFRT